MLESQRWPAAVFHGLARASLIPAQHREPYIELLSGKRGLEVGGPSAIFKPWGAILLYPVVAGLDGCNFAGQTVWEGTIRSGVSYEFLAGRKGFQFILEATNLAGIPAGAYDFVLSSHCLEHVANPLRALRADLARIGAFAFSGTLPSSAGAGSEVYGACVQEFR